MSSKTELKLEISAELLDKLQYHAADGISIQRIVEEGIKMWLVEKDLVNFVESRRGLWDY